MSNEGPEIIPYRSFYEKGDSAEEIFARCLDDYKAATTQFFADCLKKCESPIEKLLLGAICSRMRLEPTFFLAVAKAPNNLGWDKGVLCIPQVEIGKYRADFALFDMRRDPMRITVIECDGHDFHERTKDQAKRDRSRDRWFAAEGIPVLRFTGSEIYNDPFLVADEIARWIARS